MKTCSKCKVPKSLDNFYISKSRNSYIAECIQCSVTRHRMKRQNMSKEQIEKEVFVAKEYRNRNKGAISDRSKKHNLKKYGLTQECYEKLTEKQNNLCAICNKPESVKYVNNSSNLSVDHCHLTGKVRGLLCGSCNRALGLFKDSEETLQNAIEYLRKSNET